MATLLKRVYGNPFWVDTNQLPILIDSLANGKVTAVSRKLLEKGQKLNELQGAAIDHQGSFATVWTRKGTPVSAISQSPDGELKIWTSRAMILPFKSCCPNCEGDFTSAAFVNVHFDLVDRQLKSQFAVFCENQADRQQAVARIPAGATLKKEGYNFPHGTYHMINKPHDCKAF